MCEGPEREPCRAEVHRMRGAESSTVYHRRLQGPGRDLTGCTCLLAPSVWQVPTTSHCRLRRRDPLGVRTR